MLFTLTSLVCAAASLSVVSVGFSFLIERRAARRWRRRMSESYDLWHFDGKRPEALAQLVDELAGAVA